jgi:hypothetical protein
VTLTSKTPQLALAWWPDCRPAPQVARCLPPTRNTSAWCVCGGLGANAR